MQTLTSEIRDTMVYLANQESEGGTCILIQEVHARERRHVVFYTIFY